MSRDGRKRGRVATRLWRSIARLSFRLCWFGEAVVGFAGLGVRCRRLKNLVLVGVGISVSVARRGQASHADMEIETTGREPLGSCSQGPSGCKSDELCLPSGTVGCMLIGQMERKMPHQLHSRCRIDSQCASLPAQRQHPLQRKHPPAAHHLHLHSSHHHDNHTHTHHDPTPSQLSPPPPPPGQSLPPSNFLRNSTRSSTLHNHHPRQPQTDAPPTQTPPRVRNRRVLSQRQRPRRPKDCTSPLPTTISPPSLSPVPALGSSRQL